MALHGSKLRTTQCGSRVAMIIETQQPMRSGEREWKRVEAQRF
jgi:hypothetical protein